MEIKIDALKNIALVVLLALVGWLAGRQPQEFVAGEIQVLEAVDGDTIKVEGNNISVRLIGIDAPEKGQCFYEESKKFTGKLLEGRKIILEKHISELDDYGRLLRFVLLPGKTGQDNLLVNDYIVRQGFATAVASPPDNRYRDLLVSAQEEALAAKRGLWARCDYVDELSERREHDDAAPDKSFVIKGNISTRGFGKTYLFTGCDNYETVKIDLAKGEQFFRTATEAAAAGFRKATNCP